MAIAADAGKVFANIIVGAAQVYATIFKSKTSWLEAKHMGRAYAGELKRLKQTVAFARSADVEPLVALLAELASRNLIFVGSGGSYTAATFASALHERHTGQLTKALTPLEASCRPDTTNTAAVLISARGSNPDIIRAFQTLRFKEPIAAICATEHGALLRQMHHSGIGIGYGFTIPGGKDGFLATNSLLATLILLARSYGSLFGLPDDNLQGIGECPINTPGGQCSPSDVHQLAKADTIIALSSGWGWCAAVDFESKCSESGLSNVLLSDFRNFAHGRHNWLRTRAKSTAILSFEDEGNTRLATSILRLVPDDVQKIRLFSGREGPYASIELVSKVLHIVGILGVACGIDPGRPPIAMFGRKMYQNGFRAPNSHTIRQTWIARKAEAIGLLPHENDDFLAEALDSFLERIRTTHLQAIVADYDGTLAGPNERHTGLSEMVAGQLDALLSKGLVVGIATGRGASAHEGLRKVIAPRHWHKLLLGLYNGAVILPLSEEFTDQVCDQSLQFARIRKALQPLLARLSIEISQNMYQISLRPVTPINLERLRRSVTELLYDVDPSLRVYRSAHSIDVFASSNSKAVIPRALEQFSGVEQSTILRIGDLGNWGGNDFDLLNDGLSLSVDQVSSRLDSCWNLGLPGSKGTTTTSHYLRALRIEGEVFQLEVDLLGRRGSGHKR